MSSEDALLQIGKRYKRVVGIDPSPLHLGIVSLHTLTGDIRINDLIQATTDHGSNLQRYMFILRQVLPKVHPKSLVVIEGYGFNRKQSMDVTVFLAGAGEILKFSVWRKTATNPIIVPPSTLKLYISGKGNLAKDQVVQAVADRWGKRFRTTDQAEAFVLADIGRRILGTKKTAPRDYEIEALRAIKFIDLSKSLSK